MSYIMRPDSATIATPVSIGNGGTSAATPNDAMINLTSPAFANSASAPDWGSIPVNPPPAPDANENFIAINELIATLQILGVIV